MRSIAILLVLLMAALTSARAMDVSFPAGATIDGTLQQEIDSKSAQDGQRFAIRTASGTIINGHLSQVVGAKVGRKAHLTLNLDTIRFSDNTSLPIRAQVIGVEQKRQTNIGQAAGTILGGMIAGNILGKAIGTNAGGLIGIGAGGLLAANTSSNLTIPAGSVIRIKLDAPLVSGSPAH